MPLGSTPVSFTDNPFNTKHSNIIDCARLSLPIIGAILAAHIRKSDLYNEAYWKPRNYTKDQLEISETTTNNYYITRTRYYYAEQEDPQGNIISVKRSCHRSDTIYLYDDITSYIRRLALQNQNWAIKITPNAYDDAPRNVQASVKFPPFIPQNFFGFNIQTNNYNRSFKTYILMPLRAMPSSPTITSFIDMLEEKDLASVYLLLTQQALATKPTKFILFEDNEKKALLNVINQTIQNFSTGCLDPELLSMLKDIFLLRLKIRNSFYFFNRELIATQKLALDSLEQTFCAAINGEVSYINILIRIGMFLGNPKLAVPNFEFYNLLKNMQTRLQARNISAIRDCKLAPTIELRNWYLSIFYIMRITSSRDLEYLFGDQQAITNFLTEIREFIEEIEIDNNDFELLQKLFMTCFADFNEPQSIYTAQIKAIINAINGLKESKILLNKFMQINTCSSKKEILTHVSTSIKKLDDTPENRITIKVFLTWLYDKKIKAFNNQELFNLLLESRLINYLLTEDSTRQKLLESRDQFFNKIDQWLRSYSSRDKHIESLQELRKIAPEIFNLKPFRDLIVSRAVEQIKSGDGLAVLQRVENLKKAIPEEYADQGRIIELDTVAIHHYLSILTMTDWRTVGHVVDRIIAIIGDGAFGEPLSETALTHVKFINIYHDFGNLFAKIVSTKIERLLLNSESEALQEILKLLHNQPCFKLLMDHVQDYQNFNIYQKICKLIDKEVNVLLTNNQLDEIYNRYLDPNCSLVQYLKKLQLFEELKNQIAKSIVNRTRFCSQQEYLNLFYANFRGSVSYIQNTREMQDQLASTNISNHFVEIRKDILHLITADPNATDLQFNLFLRLAQQGQNEFNALLTEGERAKLNDELVLIYLFASTLQSTDRHKELENAKSNSFKQTLVKHSLNEEMSDLLKLENDITCEKALAYRNSKLDSFALQGILLFLQALKRGTRILFNYSNPEPSDLVELCNSATQGEIDFANAAQLLKESQTYFQLNKIKQLSQLALENRVQLIMPLTLLWNKLQSQVTTRNREQYRSIARAFPPTMPSYHDFLQALENDKLLKEFLEKRLSLKKTCDILKDNPELLFNLDPILRNIFSPTIINAQLKNSHRNHLLEHINSFKFILDSIGDRKTLEVQFLQKLIDTFSNHNLNEFNIDSFYQNLTTASESECLFLYLVGNENHRVEVAKTFLNKIQQFDLLKIRYNSPADLENDFNSAYRSFTPKNVQLVKQLVAEWIRKLINEQICLNTPLIHILAMITKATLSIPRRSIVNFDSGDSQPSTPTEPTSKEYTSHIADINRHNHACRELIAALKTNKENNESAFKAFFELHPNMLSYNVPTYKKLLIELRTECISIIEQFLLDTRAILVQSNDITAKLPNLHHLNSVVLCYRRLQNVDPAIKTTMDLTELQKIAMASIKDALSPIPIATANGYTQSYKKLRNTFSGHLIYCFSDQDTKQWLINTITQACQNYCVSIMYFPCMQDYAIKHQTSYSSNSNQEKTTPSEYLKIENLLQFFNYLPQKTSSDLYFMKSGPNQLLQLQFNCAAYLRKIDTRELFIAIIRHSVFTGIFGSILEAFHQTLHDRQALLDLPTYKEIIRLFWHTPTQDNNDHKNEHEKVINQLVRQTKFPDDKEHIFKKILKVLFQSSRTLNATIDKVTREPNKQIDILADITTPLLKAIATYGQLAIDKTIIQEDKSKHYELEEVFRKIRLIIGGLDIILRALTFPGTESTIDSIGSFLSKFSNDRELLDNSNHSHNVAVVVLLRIVYRDLTARHTMSGDTPTSHSLMFNQLDLGVTESKRLYSKILDKIRSLDVPIGKQMLCPLQTELLAKFLSEYDRPLQHTYEHYVRISDEMYNLYISLFGLFKPELKSHGKVNIITTPQELHVAAAYRSGTYLATKKMMISWLELAERHDSTTVLKEITSHLVSILDLLEQLAENEIHLKFYKLYLEKLENHLKEVQAGAYLFAIKDDLHYLKCVERIRDLYKQPQHPFLMNLLNSFVTNMRTLLIQNVFNSSKIRVAICNAIVFIQHNADDSERRRNWELILTKVPSTPEGNALLRTILMAFEDQMDPRLDFKAIHNKLSMRFLPAVAKRLEHQEEEQQQSLNATI